MPEEQLESAFEHQEAEDEALAAELGAEGPQKSDGGFLADANDDVPDAAADADVARHLNAEIEWGTVGPAEVPKMAPHTVDLPARRCPNFSVVGNDVTK